MMRKRIFALWAFVFATTAFLASFHLYGMRRGAGKITPAMQAKGLLNALIEKAEGFVASGSDVDVAKTLDKSILEPLFDQIKGDPSAEVKYGQKIADIASGLDASTVAADAVAKKAIEDLSTSAKLPAALKTGVAKVVTSFAPAKTGEEMVKEGIKILSDYLAKDDANLATDDPTKNFDYNLATGAVTGESLFTAIPKIIADLKVRLVAADLKWTSHPKYQKSLDLMEKIINPSNFADAKSGTKLDSIVGFGWSTVPPVPSAGIAATSSDEEFYGAVQDFERRGYKALLDDMKAYAPTKHSLKDQFKDFVDELQTAAGKTPDQKLADARAIIEKFGNLDFTHDFDSASPAKTEKLPAFLTWLKDTYLAPRSKAAAVLAPSASFKAIKDLLDPASHVAGIDTYIDTADFTVKATGGLSGTDKIDFYTKAKAFEAGIYENFRKWVDDFDPGKALEVNLTELVKELRMEAGMTPEEALAEGKKNLSLFLAKNDDLSADYAARKINYTLPDASTYNISWLEALTNLQTDINKRVRDASTTWKDHLPTHFALIEKILDPKNFKGDATISSPTVDNLESFVGAKYASATDADINGVVGVLGTTDDRKHSFYKATEAFYKDFNNNFIEDALRNSKKYGNNTDPVDTVLFTNLVRDMTTAAGDSIDDIKKITSAITDATVGTAVLTSVTNLLGAELAGRMALNVTDVTTQTSYLLLNKVRTPSNYSDGTASLDQFVGADFSTDPVVYCATGGKFDADKLKLYKNLAAQFDADFQNAKTNLATYTTALQNAAGPTGPEHEAAGRAILAQIFALKDDFSAKANSSLPAEKDRFVVYKQKASAGDTTQSWFDALKWLEDDIQKRSKKSTWASSDSEARYNEIARIVAQPNSFVTTFPTGKSLQNFLGADYVEILKGTPVIIGITNNEDRRDFNIASGALDQAIAALKVEIGKEAGANINEQFSAFVKRLQEAAGMTPAEEVEAGKKILASLVGMKDDYSAAAGKPGSGVGEEPNKFVVYKRSAAGGDSTESWEAALRWLTNSLLKGSTWAAESIKSENTVLKGTFDLMVKIVKPINYQSDVIEVHQSTLNSFVTNGAPAATDNQYNADNAQIDAAFATNRKGGEGDNDNSNRRFYSAAKKLEADLTTFFDTELATKYNVKTSDSSNNTLSSRNEQFQELVARLQAIAGSSPEQKRDEAIEFVKILKQDVTYNIGASDVTESLYAACINIAASKGVTPAIKSLDSWKQMDAFNHLDAYKASAGDVENLETFVGFLFANDDGAMKAASNTDDLMNKFAGSADALKTFIEPMLKAISIDDEYTNPAKFGKKINNFIATKMVILTVQDVIDAFTFFYKKKGVGVDIELCLVDPSSLTDKTKSDPKPSLKPTDNANLIQHGSDVKAAATVNSIPGADFKDMNGFTPKGMTPIGGKDFAVEFTGSAKTPLKKKEEITNYIKQVISDKLKALDENIKNTLIGIVQ